MKKLSNLSKSRYEIRKGYSSRPKNDIYYDGTSFNDGVVYQPDVYQLARHLAERTQAEYIIDIGAGNGEKLKEYLDGYKIIAVDCAVNLSELEENLKGKDNQVIEYDLEKGLPYVDDEVLSKSVVISSDVIEHIVNLKGYLRDLARFSQKAPFVLLSTPDRDRARGIDDYGPPINRSHVREWNASELHSLLNLNGFSNLRTGYTVNTNVNRDKSTIITISGRHNLAPESLGGIEKRSVQAIMTVFNEEDIIGSSIRNLLNEGLEVHVIDNWSTDQTAKVVKELQRDFNTKITYERFPKKRPVEYNWTALLERVDEVAKNSKADWIIHHDSDEIRKSPHPKINLQDAISFIDSLGYNVIDHTVLDFRPVKDGYKKGMNPEEFFEFYEFGKRPGHFVQFKGWKNSRNTVNLSASGGHDVTVKPRKVYPMKFLLKHYPLRSTAQARRKIFSERLPRINQMEKKKGWHQHYDHFSNTSEFIWEKEPLNKFHRVMSFQDNIVELVSGIGIDKTNA